MVLLALVPAVVSLLGACVYVLATKPEAKELGRLAFGAGLLVLLFALAGKDLAIAVR